MGKSVIIYTYYNSESSNINLNFFCKNELVYHPDIDYIIVINGYTFPDDIVFPDITNLKIIKRENIGFDYGGHNNALESIPINKQYDYYFFMNSGVIGPILPFYFQKEHWSSIFIDKINDKVKLVGTTIVCLPHQDLGGFGPKVEGFFFMTDKIGLKLLKNEKTIFCNHKDKVDAIINGEYGMSKCILKNGYSIDCMLSRYKYIDWKDINNYNANNNIHPSRKNSFYGESINPYEVIFHKWYWHGCEPVNIDIIRSYMNKNKNIFDYKYYIKNNIDLANFNNKQAFDHWIDFGSKEGRKCSRYLL